MSERVLIIVPTYNERDNLGPIIAASQAQLPDADFLVVDDGSPDGTGALADELARKDGRVHALHRPTKAGLGTAYLAGFRFGLERGYDYLCEMDADFSHDPAYLPRLVEAARAGADMVVGSRYVAGGGTRNWGAIRRLVSRGGSLYARTILGIRVRDLTAGFVCYRRSTLERIQLDGIQSSGYGFQIEMKYRVVQAGMQLVEIPIIFVDRRVGKSKMSRRIFFEALTRVWRMRLKP